MSDPLTPSAGARRSAKRRGLPSARAMRHRGHFVDELTTRDTTPVGRMMPLSSIRPDPKQPRSSMGDLSELVESVRDKGVLEPILVRALDPSESDAGDSDDAGSGASYVLISGERRFRAALEAGLYEIPAIEMEVTEQEALEIALVENLQREDLTPFEEAEGYGALAETHSYTHEQISKAVGKSRTVVTESLSLLKMPKEVQDSARALGIDSKSILLEVQKLRSPAKMLQLVERITTLGLGRDAVRREVKKLTEKGPRQQRAKPYSFQFRDPDKSYRVSVTFRQSTVEPRDLISALEEALSRLREEEARAEAGSLDG